jgi:hypothetical protein
MLGNSEELHAMALLEQDEPAFAVFALLQPGPPAIAGVAMLHAAKTATTVNMNRFIVCLQ